MASTKSRQRKLAREKYQRQMVRRAQRERRRRRVRAGIGAFVTLAVVALGSAWLLGAFDPEPEEYVADTCTWIPQDTAANPDRTEAGTPNPNPPTTGAQTFTVQLDAGEAGSGAVEMVLDRATAPCATESITHLATHDFYDGTVCHELFEGVALRCGDPSGTGLGGPTYAYVGENIPFSPQIEGEDEDEDAEPPVVYERGTVAVGDTTGQHGSQFLLFFDDYAPETPMFSIVGTVTDGLDLLEAIGAAGVTAPEDGDADDESLTGPPAHEVRITDVVVAELAAHEASADDASPAPQS